MVLTIRAIPEKFAVSTAKGTLEYWTNKHSQNTQEEKDLSAQVEELKEEYGKAEDSFWASLNALVTE
jgi:ribosomal protein L9